MRHTPAQYHLGDPTKKRHEQTNEPNHAQIPDPPPPFHSLVVTQEGSGVQVGAAEGGQAGISLYYSRRK